MTEDAEQSCRQVGSGRLSGSEFVTLAAPFQRKRTPTAVEILPLLDKMKQGSHIAMLGAQADCIASYSNLVTRYDDWVNRRPWVKKYLDPAVLFVQPAQTGHPQGVPAILGFLPPAWEIPRIHNDGAGNPIGGWWEFRDQHSANGAGAAIRTHHAAPGQNPGLPAAPPGPPVRIFTFNCTHMTEF